MSLTPIVFDPVKVKNELVKLEKLLTKRKWLEERKHILKFFKKNKQVALALGQLMLPDLVTPDRMGFEVDLWGKFKCDLVIGSSVTECILFIEFEDAQPNSLFKNTKKRQLPYWGERLKGGFFQLIDWFFILDEQRGNLRRQFGHEVTRYDGMLIVGRDPNVLGKERMRWLSSKLKLNSNSLGVRTFDDLLSELNRRYS